ncbi:MAG: formyltetrahydrofolate deformylase [Gorillibacterium sp.]|nr:formyltetrahydrofolate deformylase [Gorillibacterium sp.]
MNGNADSRATLLISCNDKPGIVSRISTLLYHHKANIVTSDQYTTDPVNGMFFMRIEFDIAGILNQEHELREAIASLAQKIEFQWQMYLASEIKRMAIFVSKEDHALLELLWQWRSGDLRVEIPLIISNHEESRVLAEQMGIPFVYIPVDRNNKLQAETEQLRVLEENAVDFVVLARYMQILTPLFVERYRNRIINIHHSFLPAFIGAKPYERAYERGVKIIGATAHYVNEQLDEGPIIEQDIHRVTHNESAVDLKKMGRYVERTVLARAVKWHIEDRIIIHGNKTIVFI